jgi:regulator of replication initiation timing
MLNMFDSVDKVVKNFNVMVTRLENIRDDMLTQAEVNEAAIATLQLEVIEYRDEASRADYVAAKIKALVA